MCGCRLTHCFYPDTFKLKHTGTQAHIHICTHTHSHTHTLTHSNACTRNNAIKEARQTWQKERLAARLREMQEALEEAGGMRMGG